MFEGGENLRKSACRIFEGADFEYETNFLTKDPWYLCIQVEGGIKQFLHFDMYIYPMLFLVYTFPVVLLFQTFLTFFESCKTKSGISVLPVP